MNGRQTNDCLFSSHGHQKQFNVQSFFLKAIRRILASSEPPDNMTSLTTLPATPSSTEIACKWTNHSRVAHCHRELWKKLGELVSGYDDGERLTVSYAARGIESCVYPTVLCLLRVSFLLRWENFPRALMSSEPWALQIDVIWVEEVTLGMYSGCGAIIGVIHRVALE